MIEYFRRHTRLARQVFETAEAMMRRPKPENAFILIGQHLKVIVLYLETVECKRFYAPFPIYDLGIIGTASYGPQGQEVIHD